MRRAEKRSNNGIKAAFLCYVVSRYVSMFDLVVCLMEQSSIEIAYFRILTAQIGHHFTLAYCRQNTIPWIIACSILFLRLLPAEYYSLDYCLQNTIP